MNFSPIEQMKKPVKYVILGPVKCGTVSLQHYYRTKYLEYECKRVESIWRDDGLDRWANLKKKYPEAIPVIITRNVVDAVTSYFNYFRYLPQDLTFEEFLDRPIKNHRHGQLPSIVHGYYFKPWIEKWSSINPIIISLEEISKLPDFPVKNVTEGRRQLIKGLRRENIILTPEQKQLVLERFNKLVGDDNN